MKAPLTKIIVLMMQAVTLLILLELSACRGGDCFINNNGCGPELPCKVEGACDATIHSYIYSLNRRGIKVITMGQAYLISIPASDLFDDETPHLTWCSYSLLNEVALFLKQFRKIAIHITSYSDKYVSPKREYALTLARSRVVGEYLWTQGIDSRFIFTEGIGSDKPISRFSFGGDRSLNARVEIIFRRAVA